MATVNEKLTSLADKIRVLSGTENAMGLDAMTTHVGDANDEVATQTDLLGQIATALEGKMSNGGSGGSFETCTIHAVEHGGKVAIVTSVLSNGKIETVNNETAIVDTVENVVCGTIMYLYNNDGLIPSFNHTCTYFTEHPDGYSSYIVPYLEDGEELIITFEEDW